MGIEKTTAIGLGVVVAVAFAIYLGFRITQDVEPSPCDAGAFPVRCYYIPKETCGFFWAKAEASCKEKVRSLSLPPTRLIGPIVAKCQQSTMDKAFNRVSSPECDRLHEDLEGWRMRNSDFQ